MAAKPRVHEIAHELGADTKDVLALLRLDGEYVKSASNAIEMPVVRRVRAFWRSRGEAFVRNLRTFEPLELEWTPRSMPTNIDRILAALRTLSSTAATVKLLNRASAERRFHFVRTMIDDTSDDPLPPPPTGVAFYADTQQLLAWTSDKCIMMSAQSLAAGEPNARLRKLDVRGSDAVEAVHTLASIRTPELGQRRMGAHVPVNDAPGAAVPDVVLVYRALGDAATGSSPTSRRAPDHRWNVHGHARRQWYPREQTHKQIWIDDHSSGPRDAPLVNVERVEVY